MLANYRTTLKRHPPAPTYHSRHGGLWIDRSDWRERMAELELGWRERREVRRFVEQGFIILRRAASPAVVDAFQARIARAFREGDGRLLYQRPLLDGTHALTPGVDRLGTRVVDSYMAFPEALDLFSSPRLLRFLRLIFREEPLLFQSLSFDQGSGQSLHQDTAYVVVDRPLELAACWIALEDIQAGSGELMYAPGSHRYGDFDFGSGAKHFDPDRDPAQAHHRWGEELRARAAAGGVSTFLARKGDILVWHADLAHGGSPVTRPELTRQSLVGHFCPRSARPNYFRWKPTDFAVRSRGELSYCSDYYTRD
jgi:phytanoyl-CoA hydroxylase